MVQRDTDPGQIAKFLKQRFLGIFLMLYFEATPMQNCRRH
jgi:hypothetical protein